MKSTHLNVAVIDTNVLVSGLLSSNSISSSSVILDRVRLNLLMPVYNREILVEYNDVLRRKKFGFYERFVRDVIRTIVQNGMEIPFDDSYCPDIPDSSDRFFLHAFEQSKAFGAYLITGNLKHYPVNERIVSPGEFISYLTN